MVGRRSPQNPLISRLTLPPETIPSCYRRMRHTEFQPHSGRHHWQFRPVLRVHCDLCAERCCLRRRVLGSTAAGLQTGTGQTGRWSDHP
jgi:hypothetical protein